MSEHVSRQQVFETVSAAVLDAVRRHGVWTSFDEFMADRPHEVVPEVVAELAPVMRKHKVPLTQLMAVVMLWNAQRGGAWATLKNGGSDAEA
jgi:hypothetical protein